MRVGRKFEKFVGHIDEISRPLPAKDWNIRARRDLLEFKGFGEGVRIAGIIDALPPAKVSKCREDSTSRNASLTTAINLPA